MTTQQKLVQKTLTLLELGEYLQNVSEACRISGCSRQHFYDIKKAYESQGLEGLKEKILQGRLEITSRQTLNVQLRNQLLDRFESPLVGLQRLRGKRLLGLAHSRRPDCHRSAADRYLSLFAVAVAVTKRQLCPLIPLPPQKLGHFGIQGRDQHAPGSFTGDGVKVAGKPGGHVLLRNRPFSRFRRSVI